MVLRVDAVEIRLLRLESVIPELENLHRAPKDFSEFAREIRDWLEPPHARD